MLVVVVTLFSTLHFTFGLHGRLSRVLSEYFTEIWNSLAFPRAVGHGKVGR